MPQEIVGGRHLVTYAELGNPVRKGDYKIASLGTVVLDDADIHYGTTKPSPAFYVKRSRALGPGAYVVVARVQTA